MIMCCCWLKPSKFSMIMKVVNKNTEDRGRKSKCKISKDKKYHVNGYLSCSEQLFRSWSETLIINRPGFISLIAWISLLVRNIDFWLISLIIFFFFCNFHVMQLASSDVDMSILFMHTVDIPTSAINCSSLILL